MFPDTSKVVAGPVVGLFYEHTETQSQKDQRSGVASTAADLAASLSQSLERTEQDATDSRHTKVNLVLGQLKGLYPTEVLADEMAKEGKQLPSIELLNAGTFSKITKSVGKWLPTASSGSSKAASLLTQAQRSKIGLLRSPSLDESQISNTDYNESMAQTALMLGLQLRGYFKEGACPEVKSLWATCRAWRVGRLDKNSNKEEIEFFSKPREEFDKTSVTPIGPKDIRYGQMIDQMLEQIQGVNLAQATRGHLAVFGQRKSTLPNGAAVDLITIRHSVMTRYVMRPLTEMRIAVDERGRAVRHLWVCPNDDTRIMKACISHTQVRFLEDLLPHLQDELKLYGDLAKQQVKKLNLKKECKSVDPRSVDFLPLVERLGRMHYLLAHMMLDHRGSAAKSELLIRALAVSAGLELPPFKAGFVPDLVAFLSSRDEFSKNYSNSFE